MPTGLTCRAPPQFCSRLSHLCHDHPRQNDHEAVPNTQCLVLQQYIWNGHAFLDAFLWVATAAATKSAAYHTWGWIKANAVHVLR